MTALTFHDRRKLETLEPWALRQHQIARLNALLASILPTNRFYAEKIDGLQLPIDAFAALDQLPYTFKEELIDRRHNGDLAANLTYPADNYIRYHQTSGTSGRPIVVLDTAEDWEWWVNTWQFTLDAADINASDKALLAFSFGPFIGFWSAFEAVTRRGAMAVPGGGMNTLQRLELLRGGRANVLFCTPSYALHMAEVAEEHKLDPRTLGVRALILSGEPGASSSETRDRIAQWWHADVIDHSGATEIGPWGYSDPERRGLHVIETEFIAEFLSVEHGGPAAAGELSELVLTSLGRFGSPVIRYRTGDLVRPSWPADSSNRFVLLEGGVLGRTDDMMIIRGVNVFPSAVESILRGFPEVLEFRLRAFKVAQMDQLEVEIEDRLEQPRRVAEELRLRLGLNVEVRLAPLGSLPRFEGKGRRFLDERRADAPPHR
jgi:phenylacetate-CoA ligase